MQCCCFASSNHMEMTGAVAVKEYHMISFPTGAVFGVDHQGSGGFSDTKEHEVHTHSDVSYLLANRHDVPVFNEALTIKPGCIL